MNKASGSPVFPQRKAEWALSYDDGSEKIVVSFDRASEHCPDKVLIEMASQWLYVDAADVPWLAAGLGFGYSDGPSLNGHGPTRLTGRFDLNRVPLLPPAPPKPLTKRQKRRLRGKRKVQS